MTRWWWKLALDTKSLRTTFKSKINTIKGSMWLTWSRAVRVLSGASSNLRPTRRSPIPSLTNLIHKPTPRILLVPMLRETLRWPRLRSLRTLLDSNQIGSSTLAAPLALALQPVVTRSSWERIRLPIWDNTTSESEEHFLITMIHSCSKNHMNCNW